MSRAENTLPIDAIEPLELRDGQWLPAGSPDASLLMSFTEQRTAPEATRTLELGQQAGTRVICPGCGGTILFQLETQVQHDGSEHWVSKPCPICEYSKLVTIVPTRAVVLRKRIEAMQKVGIRADTTNRYNRLLKQYRRVMARADKTEERTRHDGSAHQSPASSTQ